MSANPICPKCWYTNLAGATFCYHCGTLLPIGQPTPAASATLQARPVTRTSSSPPSPASPFYGSTDYYSLFKEKTRREGISRTKTGLPLLTMGTLLGLPVLLGFPRGAGLLGEVLWGLTLFALGIAAGILSIIGALLVILGREAFGKAHSNQVLWSVGFYVGGGVITGTSTVVFISGNAVAEIKQTGAGLQDTLSSDFYILLIGNLIGLAVSGLAYVLITYSLQKPRGHLFLWATYVAGLSVGAIVLSYVGSQVHGTVQAAVSGGTLSLAPIRSLQIQAISLINLNSITRAVFAVAYFFAWSRINKGEIPLSTPTPSHAVPNPDGYLTSAS